MRSARGQTQRITGGTDGVILITHAFSRRNQGDGLLVDLTLEALEQAGFSAEECLLLALDANSFSDLRKVRQAPGESTARVTPRLFRAGVEVGLDLVSGVLEPALTVGTVARIARKAEGIVAVGGGYLVTDSASRQIGVLMNHLVQLRVSGRKSRPTVYFPQSIGPLSGIVGRWVRASLRQIDRVYVRDKLSEVELSGSNVKRCADLAVLKLARTFQDMRLEQPDPSSTILVLRDLPNAPGYIARAQALAANVSDPVFAVQADVEGHRSDRMFYEKLAVPSAGPFSDVRANGPARVVVSVRLHGAIAALMAGYPAIHLAYERKGWGAYTDLNLDEFVHDARDFSPYRVANQVRKLQADSTEYWHRVERASGALREQHDELVTDLRSRLVKQ